MQEKHNINLTRSNYVLYAAVAVFRDDDKKPRNFSHYKVGWYVEL